VWAPHWYAAVEASTGFAPYDPRRPRSRRGCGPLAEAVRPYYDELAAHRIEP
jgi:hypothetical protein